MDSHSIEEKVTQKLGRDDRFEIHLGEALLDAGYLTQDQLGQAMWERSGSLLRLQEICLEHGWVTKEQVYALVPTQQLRLGEILLLHSEISIDQLSSVLTSQETRRPRRPLGELIVQQGWIPSERLKWALAEQEELHRLAASNSWQVINGGASISSAQKQSGGRETLQELQDAIAGYKHQISVLERQLAAQKQTPSSGSMSSSERKRYEDRISTLENLLKQASQPCSTGENSTTTERQRYEQQIKGLEQQVSDSQRLKDQLTAGYEARISMLEQQLAQQKQEWEAFCSESNQEIASYHTQYQQQIQWRDLQLQQQAQQQQALQESIYGLQVELQSAQTALEQQYSLQQQYTYQQNQDQQQIQTLKDSVDRLQTDLDRTQQHLQAVEAEANQLRQKLETYQTQVDKVQQTKARLISDLAEARRHRLALEQQIQAQGDGDHLQQIQYLNEQLEHQRQENRELRQQGELERTTLNQRLRQLQEELSRQKAHHQAQELRNRISEPSLDSSGNNETLHPGKGK